jgi:quinoprotein glucose dehydrogenase
MGTIQYKSMALAVSATALTLGTWFYPTRATLAAPASRSAESAAPKDWSVYNGGVNGDHYSPLTQITPANVAGLKQVWRVDVGVDVACRRTH